MPETEEKTNEMLVLKREKLEDLKERGEDPFLIEKYEHTHNSATIKENFEELEEKAVSIAGRMMSRRGHGKISFIDIQDGEGKIQIFAQMNSLGKEAYNELKDYDLGDIIGVKGEVRSEEHTSELQSRFELVCRLLLEKKKI